MTDIETAAIEALEKIAALESVIGDIMPDYSLSPEQSLARLGADGTCIRIAILRAKQALQDIEVMKANRN